MDFFSDIPAEVARDALVMTAIVNDGSVRKGVANGAVSGSSGGGGISGAAVSASSGSGRAGVSSTSTARMVDTANADGSVSTLTNRLHRDGSVSASLAGHQGHSQAGGFSASGPSYSSGSQKLTAEKAYEMRQLLEEDGVGHVLLLAAPQPALLVRLRQRF